MRFQEMIETVDTHTGGEPTRIILSGIPKLEGNSVREKRDYFKEHYDYIRTRLTYEPRGHAGMLCAAVVPPTMPEADFGIFYMDDVQYLDMCGHASIGVGTALQEIGLVPKAHRDRYAIETPAAPAPAPRWRGCAPTGSWPSMSPLSTRVSWMHPLSAW